MTSALTVVDDDARPTVVLINVGTPAAPTPSAVRRYLRAFLSDPRVIDLPALARWLLLHLVILPFRPRRSAALYRAIWTQQGSPLLVHGRALVDALQARLPSARVLLGMRYGDPALADVLVDAPGRVVLVPLFPQEASATTGSALCEAYRLLGASPRVPAVSVVPPFFHDNGFVEVVTSTIMESTSAGVDAILLSYHGVPVSQVQGTVAAGHTCGGDDATGCCATLGVANAGCYRAQCLATSRALEARLRIGGVTAPVSTAFQSRLGRARWIGPSTSDAIAALARSGVKRLVVACPSFVADCLETLEEIGVQGRAQFLAAGGERFTLVPCVNADPRFVEVLARLVGAALGDHVAAQARRSA
ncbi:MAG: ferrochelatase [Deltaproteobacteria bacterium]|nr:ferrochelatase [Deltaproteobacteria bacterium]